MKTIAIYTRFTMALALATSLFACGGANETQDGALPGSLAAPQIDNSTVIAGVAMNGYIANGLVWLDIKDNNTLDGTEPVAYTDAQGYFSYNPISGVNYCASEKAHLQHYCLKTGLREGSVEVKVTKGIQVLTGVSFKNVMSAQVDLEAAANNFSSLVELGAKPAGDTKIWQQQVDSLTVALSPLGTLAHYSADSAELLEALSVLSLEFSADVSASELLQMNYVEGVLLDLPGARELLSANILISTLVDNYTGLYNATFENFDLGFNGLPISTADGVYQGMAQSVISVFTAQTGTESVVSNSTYRHLKDLTVASMPEEYFEAFAIASQNATNEILSNFGSDLSEADKQLLEQNINAVTNNMQVTEFVVDVTDLHRFFGTSTIATNNNISDTANAIFAVHNSFFTSIPYSSTSPENGSEINLRRTLVAETKRVVSQGLVDDYNRVFSVPAGDEEANQRLGNNIDIQALANAIPKNLANFSDIPSGIDFSLASIESNDSILSNKHLSLSGVQDGGEQGQVVVFFAGNDEDAESDQNSGSLIMCIAYNNDEDPSENISGQLFEGSWNTIGDSQNRISLLAEGFSLQMNIAGETRGSDIPPEQEVPSLQRNPNEAYGKFRFTLNDDSATWHSDHASVALSYGLQSTETVPSSGADCENFLSL